MQHERRIAGRNAIVGLAMALLVAIPGLCQAADAASASLSVAPAVATGTETPPAPAPALANTPATGDPAVTPAATLGTLLAATPLPADPSADIRCLATATYFEAGHTSPAGQLAVARVIVARTRSGRFPSSYCGVVMQPSQFSFVRHHRLPEIAASNPAWQSALRIAVIADGDAWKSPVEGALFFHAAHVSRRMGRERMALVDGNVFFR